MNILIETMLKFCNITKKRTCVKSNDLSFIEIVRLFKMLKLRLLSGGTPPAPPLRYATTVLLCNHVRLLAIEPVNFELRLAVLKLSQYFYLFLTLLENKKTQKHSCFVKSYVDHDYCETNQQMAIQRKSKTFF